MKIIPFLVVALLLLGNFARADQSVTNIIVAGSVWKYLDSGSDQGTVWLNVEFDDTTWASGKAQLGYGDGDEASVIGYGPDADNKFITSYFRHAFMLNGVEQVSQLKVRLLRDDGAVVYLNGNEVLRSNLPAGVISATTLASVTATETDETMYFEMNVDPHLLVNGVNVVAVETHQDRVDSSDMSFDLELIGQVVTPDPGPAASNLTNIITAGSAWKYLDNGSDQGTVWPNVEFDDASWASGKAQLGYGDGDEATVISYGSDADNKYITSYFRHAVMLNGVEQVSQLKVRLLRDDGAVVYLNGTEVFRSNLPAGVITATTLASATAIEADETTYFEMDIDPRLLVNSVNVVAVEIHQDRGDSSDISFDLELIGQVSPPNQAPVVNAGPDQAISLDTTTMLNGLETDDGLPLPAASSASWSKVIGPGSVVFGNINAATTTASFSEAGIYVLRLTANDNSLSSSDDTTIIVNAAPVVSAGPDQYFSLPASANLMGSVSDDGLPNGPGAVVATWTKTSGPGVVTFGNVNAPVTTASFSIAGTYMLRLTANDGALTSYKEATLVAYNANPASSTIQMPIYVTWPDRNVESASFSLSGFNPADTLTLRCTVHGLNYDGKMGFSFNNGVIYPVKNSTVTVQGNGKTWGGMAGGFHTLTWEATLPANTLKLGANTLSFWYFDTNPFNAFFQHQPYSYQVLDFNIKAPNGNYLIPAATFVQDNPAQWAPIYTDAANLALGKDLWFNAPLQTITGAPMIARCTDCHMKDGRDLQYFGYHNKAIIARAKVHGLSQLNAERIASYIRSLTTVPILGRPWNPPYQPGPGLDSKPLNQWAAGAGLAAVVANDVDIAPYLFPGGIITNTAIGLHQRMSTREIPTELQLPDWNHWLPQVHPLDAFGAAKAGQTKLLAWYDAGIGFVPGSTDESYVLRRVLKKGSAPSVLTAQTFWERWDQQGTALRSLSGIPDYPTSEFDAQKIYSIRLWQMVKTAELMMEFELEEIVPQQLLKPSPDPRMWRTALAFETSPNILHLNNQHHGIANNTPQMWYYFTMAWYHLQLVLNGGSRCYLGSDYQHGQRPLDWGYMHGFLKSWPEVTGRGNAYMYMEYCTKGLQSMDNGRGPEHWGMAGWNPHAQYGIYWLFSVEKPCFSNVSITTRRQLCEALLRNWIAGNKLYPAANYYRMASTPWLQPLARPDWVYPQQSPSGVDYLVNGIWKCFGTGANSMQGYGIDKALQNEILSWAKTVWPLANWDSLRPPP